MPPASFVTKRQANRLVFLGTGAAWRTPELSCACPTCTRMRALGEKRTRTSLWFEGPCRLLLDCGPDVAEQLERSVSGCPNAVLITHEHGDHYLGLDDLEAFRRSRPRGDFPPLPVYAHPQAWPVIETRFNYLFGRLLEQRQALVGHPLTSLPCNEVIVTPFKTDHGPMPQGSVGYVLEYPSQGRTRKLVYTSDFEHLPDPPPLLFEPDFLVAQAHWFNQPKINRPHHMSLQRLIGFVRDWRPRRRVFLVHISDSDLTAGEKPVMLKKEEPLDPLRHPRTGRLFDVPTCQAEWQAAAEEVFDAFQLNVQVTVAYDGLTVEI